MRAVLMARMLLMSGASTAANQLPNDVSQALRVASEITIVSLDPWPEETVQIASASGDQALAEQIANLPRMYGRANLGSVVLIGEDMRAAAAEFERAVAAGGDAVSMCFDPRHAIRVTHAGHVYELLQCYDCGGMRVCRDATSIAHLITSGSPETLNALMLAHGLEPSTVFQPD